MEDVAGACVTVGFGVAVVVGVAAGFGVVVLGFGAVVRVGVDVCGADVELGVLVWDGFGVEVLLDEWDVEVEAGEEAVVCVFDATELLRAAEDCAAVWVGAEFAREDPLELGAAVWTGAAVEPVAAAVGLAVDEPLVLLDVEGDDFDEELDEEECVEWALVELVVGGPPGRVGTPDGVLEQAVRPVRHSAARPR